MTVQEVFAVKTLGPQISVLSSDKDTSISSPQAPDPIGNSPKTLRSQTSTLTGTSTSITFGSQPELPPLPIPSLDETLNKFLQNLEALQEDEQERSEAQNIVLEFMKDDGPKLQELLLSYDREGRETGEMWSCVKQFWNDSYLAPDSSIVLNLNPLFVLEDSPDPKIVPFAGEPHCVLLLSNLPLSSDMKNLKPDSGKPLCMNHQSRALFAASRVPMKNSKDSIHVFDKSNHVAVMCCAQLYYFQALWPDGHCAIDEGDLVDILSAIHSHAIAMDHVDSSKSAIGVLTSLNRNEWATARDDIIKNPKNEEGLQIVDSALFVLVLDDYIPKNKHCLFFLQADGDAWAP
jgi:carnitine O-acetyltransferase